MVNLMHMILNFFITPFCWMFLMMMQGDGVGQPPSKRAATSSSHVPFATAKASDFNAFLRRLVYNMDNCGGTNKSQYCFGSIAFLIMFGKLDQVELYFQLAGHTKFDPDVTAQKTAGAYNRSDTFNHAMLNQHLSAHCTAVAYDEGMLLTWREATPAIFEAVGEITQYHQFMFLVDDGHLNLGEPQVKENSKAADFPSNGPVYSDAVLQREAMEAAKRSLMKSVIPSIVKGEYTGLGAGTGNFGTPTVTFVPLVPKIIRKVRLFKRLSESHHDWIEQVGYMQTTDPEKIAEALKKVVPIVQGQLEGPRKKQVDEQMKSYVDPKYVPDEYAISGQGQSGLVKGISQSLLFGAKPPAPAAASSTAPSSSSAAAAPKKARWSLSLHGPKLIAYCKEHHGGFFPDVGSHHFSLKLAIAKHLGLEYESVKRGAASMIKAETLESVAKKPKPLSQTEKKAAKAAADAAKAAGLRAASSADAATSAAAAAAAAEYGFE